MSSQGRVSFVGAGPGAADLITVRGARRLAEADIIVWAASLVDPECIREHAREDAELIDSSLITHEDVIEVYRRALRDHKRVARVHSGDPALWGAVQEQYDACQRLGIEVEIVPGVSAFSAAAAVVGRELTLPEVAQSVILTRLEGGKTPMPDGEQIREFARHGTTMAIFLSAARSGQLVEELLAGGYAEDTPVVVAYKATWPDELILHTTIGELVEQVKQHKLWRHTLFLVGRALRAGGTRSHLYNAGHFHTYRKADPAARRALRASKAGEPGEGGEGGEGESAQKSRAGWPLHTSRSGWVAARIANGWSPTQRTKSDDEQAQPASVAAWSAVRGWQETARSAGRPGARVKQEAKPAPDQGTLALDEEPEVTAPEVIAPDVAAKLAEPAVAAAPIETEPVEAVEPADVAPVEAEPVVEAAPEPKPEARPATEPAPKPRNRAKPTGRAAPRKQTGRKPAGKGSQPRRNSGGTSGK
ncbi:MAG TPA: precorrin-4 C(11)-methyltransferase [Pseudonocardiaceae bacterium]|nr:precorrin-4 C(11)-methyltransferase [Pseudonocardiaceae bacterium]